MENNSLACASQNPHITGQFDSPELKDTGSETQYPEGKKPNWLSFHKKQRKE
jgi:hypothetical protein